MKIEMYNNSCRTYSTRKPIPSASFTPKFKIGQHIKLKEYPSDIEIIDINLNGYVYMGLKEKNGYIWGKERKTIPFMYENDYELLQEIPNLITLE